MTALPYFLLFLIRCTLDLQRREHAVVLIIVETEHTRALRLGCWLRIASLAARPLVTPAFPHFSLCGVADKDGVARCVEQDACRAVVVHVHVVCVQYDST